MVTATNSRLVAPEAGSLFDEFMLPRELDRPDHIYVTPALIR
jgi:hypothetical protein